MRMKVMLATSMVIPLLATATVMQPNPSSPDAQARWVPRAHHQPATTTRHHHDQQRDNAHVCAGMQVEISAPSSTPHYDSLNLSYNALADAVWTSWTFDCSAAAITITCTHVHLSRARQEFVLAQSGDGDQYVMMMNDTYSSNDAAFDDDEVQMTGHHAQLHFTATNGRLSVFLWAQPATHTQPKLRCLIGKQLADTTTAASSNATITTSASTDDLIIVYDNETHSDIDTESRQVACGAAGHHLQHQHHKIVGGSETLAHQYPWMAALIMAGRSTPFCGCSIINTRYVVTAAHCVHHLYASVGGVARLQVLVAKHRLGYDRDQKRFMASQVIVHGRFNVPTKLSNDIALVKLRTSLAPLMTRPERHVAPVCLPRGACLDCWAGSKAVVAGWGRLGTGVPRPPPYTLRHAAVPILPHMLCRRRYATAGIPITNNMLCAGVRSGEKDACQGDSGGPLMVPSQRATYTLVGIVSFGVGCGRPGYPGVYTHVARYVHWISRYTPVMFA